MPSKPLLYLWSSCLVAHTWMNSAAADWLSSIACPALRRHTSKPYFACSSTMRWMSYPQLLIHKHTHTISACIGICTHTHTHTGAGTPIESSTDQRFFLFYFLAYCFWSCHRRGSPGSHWALSDSQCKVHKLSPNCRHSPTNTHTHTHNTHTSYVYRVHWFSTWDC